MSSEIRYLNTDLDIIGNRDLTPLMTALEGRNFYSLHMEQREDGHWHASFEMNETFPIPDETISQTLDGIESLSGDARTLWSECSLREFNIGYVCGDHPRGFNNGLSNRTLVRLCSVGATLRITLYPPDPIE